MLNDENLIRKLLNEMHLKLMISYESSIIRLLSSLIRMTSEWEIIRCGSWYVP